MNVIIKATNHELTEPTRDLIENKFGVFDRWFRRQGDEVVLQCEVEQSVAVERAGARYRAEGNLNVNGEQYRAEAMSGTLEGAVDAVRDELIRELSKERGKKQSLLKRGRTAIKNMLRRERRSDN